MGWKAIEMSLGWLGPFALMPTRTQYDGAWPQRLCTGVNTLDKFVEILCTPEINRSKCRANPCDMNMGINKPWISHCVIKVYDRGV